MLNDAAMPKKEVDPQFREFAKARGDRREVWFHRHFFVFLRVVHLNGILLGLGGALFFFAWLYALTSFGVAGDSPFITWAFFADFVVVYVVAMLHSRSV
jgi:hypothetical protein